MEDRLFPIGFWNYPNVSQTPVSDVSSWERAGITCNQTPYFDYGRNRPEEMIAVLDEMYARHIRAVVCINDLNFYHFVDDPEAFRAVFARALADFGNHPAVWAWFIGDEPSGDKTIAACVRCMEIIREDDPRHIPFLNFLPYWRTFDRDVLGGRNFDEWIDEFIQKSGCPLICYDCYAQMNPGEEGWDMYFLNLNKYVGAAERNGVKLWNTLLSCGHFRYRVPSEDDLRWQVSTAVASGCNGLLWFLWYGQRNQNNYRGSPVDELGEESETYRALRRVQLLFHRRYGNLLTTLTHVSTYHYVKTYGDYTEYTPFAVPHLQKVTSVHGLPGIVSHFRDAEGRDYVAVVNNTPFESGLHQLEFDGSPKRIWRYWDGNKPDDFILYHHDASYSADGTRATVGVWLAPGQMEIFRVEY